MSTAAPEPLPSSPLPSPAGPSCERSSLPPAVRLAITFGVLLALKWWLLPALGWSAALQVLALLVVATLFAWRFWWNCSSDRRGVIVLVSVLWIAGAAKILLQSRA